MMTQRSKKICPVCGSDEYFMSKIPEYKGMCDACAAEKIVEEMENQWQTELDIYAERTGDLLNYNEFYYECKAGNIDRNRLRGLKELQECYDDAMLDLKEYSQQNTSDYNDLPF